jgi:ADP-heptose:LPS heptosyltransferase
VTLVPDVRRIAVLRASALGDFVFALPALASIRGAYPRAEIVLLARTWHRELLDGRPSPVDRVVALPAGFVGDDGPPLPAAERERILADLRSERFDLAIQLHGGGRNSNPVVARLGARVTAGAGTPDAPPLDRLVPYVYWQREVTRWLEVAALVGARPTTYEPELAVTDRDRERSERVVSRDGGPIAVVHPGATDPRRRWPAERFGAVARRLAGDGRRVVVTGTAAEGDVTRAVIEASGGRALDTTGRIDLPALVGLLARADVVVSNDTGPLHLANAVGARTVGIFWVGNAINAAPPFRARHRPLLSWRLDCPVCGMNCITGRCEHDASFVDGVSVDEVLGAVAALVAPAPRAAASVA